MTASTTNESSITQLQPTSWFISAANIMKGGDHNASLELNAPTFRSDLEDHYILILFFFVLVVILGTVLNILEIYFIIKNKLYKEATNMYFLNLAVADIIKCNVTLPFSFMSLLFQNWILGEFFCYFLPMLQYKWETLEFKADDFELYVYKIPKGTYHYWKIQHKRDVPVHVTILTLLMIVFDRYLFVRNPAKARLPGFIFSTGAWLTAVCIALPYPIYTTYLNLEELVNVSHAYGAGVCLFGIEKNLKEYSLGIFIGMFVTPFIVIGFLFVNIFQTLEEYDQPIVVDGNEIRLRATFRRYYTLHRFNRGIFSNQSRAMHNNSSMPLRTENSSIADNYEVDPKEEEKYVQLHFLYMIIIFVVCFAPLNTCSKVVFLNIHETYEISSNIDKIFVICTIIGFLPTITTPLLVLSLLMNEDDKILLKNYFKRHRSGGGGNFELEENFHKVAYISHPSAVTISTDTDVDMQQERSFFRRSNSKSMISEK